MAILWPRSQALPRYTILEPLDVEKRERAWKILSRE